MVHRVVHQLADRVQMPPQAAVRLQMHCLPHLHCHAYMPFWVRFQRSNLWAMSLLTQTFNGIQNSTRFRNAQSALDSPLAWHVHLDCSNCMSCISRSSLGWLIMHAQTAEVCHRLSSGNHSCASQRNASSPRQLKCALVSHQARLLSITHNARKLHSSSSVLEHSSGATILHAADASTLSLAVLPLAGQSQTEVAAALHHTAGR